MTFYIDQSRINQLQVIFNQLDSNPSARENYYSLLSSWGSTYADLALGVVKNNTLSGRIANEFARQVAVGVGKPYSAAIELEISKDLMRSDFLLRQSRLTQVKLDTGNPNATIPELTVDQIRTYHTAAFQENGNIPPYAWTAYWPTILARDGFISGYNESGMWAALQNNGAFAAYPTNAYTAQLVNGGLMTAVMAGEYARYFWQAATTGAPLSAAQTNAMLGIQQWLTSITPGLIKSTLAVPQVFGSAQQDMLVGGGVSVAFYPGSGGDLVIGNGPADQVRYSDAPKAIVVDLRAVNAVTSDGWGFSDRLANVEIIYGSLYDDQFIFGQSKPNMGFYGDGGKDIVQFYADSTVKTLSFTKGTGGISGNIVMTPSGQSAVSINGVEDIVVNLTGALSKSVTVTGNLGVSTTNIKITGGDGNDLLDASGVNFAVTLDGGAGADTLKGGGGNDFMITRDNDTLFGGGGNDTLSGGGVLDGGAGVDTYIVGSSTKAIYAESGDIIKSLGVAGSVQKLFYKGKEVIFNRTPDGHWLSVDGHEIIKGGAYSQIKFADGGTVDVFGNVGFAGSEGTYPAWNAPYFTTEARTIDGKQATFLTTWQPTLDQLPGIEGNRCIVYGAGRNVGLAAPTGVIQYGDFYQFNDAAGNFRVSGVITSASIDLETGKLLTTVMFNKLMMDKTGTYQPFKTWTESFTSPLLDPSKIEVSAQKPFTTFNGSNDEDNIVFTSSSSWSGVQILNTKGGNDKVNIANVVVNLKTGAGDDLVYAQAGSANSTIDGGAGHDYIQGYNQNSFLYGGAGNDILFQAIYSSGGEGNDTLNSLMNNSTLVGGSGDDIVSGNQTTTVIWEQGADTITGAASVIVRVPTATLATANTTPGGIAQWLANQGVVIVPVSGVYPTIIGQAVDDVIWGNKLGTAMTGGNGAETLFALEGADTLTGGLGNDTLDGGSGQDVFVFSANQGQDVVRDDDGDAGDILYFNAGITPANVTLVRNGNDLVLTLATGGKITIEDQFSDTALKVGSAKFAGGGALSLDVAITSNPFVATGTPDNNFLIAPSGSSATSYRVEGLGGLDTIFGSNGADSIIGGAGADYLYGGVGNDLFISTIADANGDMLADYQKGDILCLTGAAGLKNTDITLASAGGLTNVTIKWAGVTSVLSVTQVFSSFTITANGGDGHIRFNVPFTPYINGTDGNDEITAPEDGAGRIMAGKNGNDTLFGSANADTLSGDNGNDQLSGNNGDDIIMGSYNNDKIWGNDGNDWLRGDWHADTLWGGQGADTLDGGYDADIIEGGIGNDVLIGGIGADKFRMIGTGLGNDIVKDFSLTQGDRIVLATGTTYTTTDLGADIKIVANGNSITLIGVADFNASMIEFAA